jgi:hypothetical protein
MKKKKDHSTDLKNPAASCEESSIPMERKHTYRRSLNPKQTSRNALAKGFSAAIKSLNSADFDGHTDFISFLPEKKFLWLSNAAQFWCLTNKNSSKKATTARNRNNN